MLSLKGDRLDLDAGELLAMTDRAVVTLAAARYLNAMTLSALRCSTTSATTDAPAQERSAVVLVLVAVGVEKDIGKRRFLARLGVQFRDSRSRRLRPPCTVCRRL